MPFIPDRNWCGTTKKRTSALQHVSNMSLQAKTLSGSTVFGKYFWLTWSVFIISVRFLPSTCERWMNWILRKSQVLAKTVALSPALHTPTLSQLNCNSRKHLIRSDLECLTLYVERQHCPSYRSLLWQFFCLLRPTEAGAMMKAWQRGTLRPFWVGFQRAITTIRVRYYSGSRWSFHENKSYLCPDLKLNWRRELLDKYWIANVGLQCSVINMIVHLKYGTKI